MDRSGRICKAYSAKFSSERLKPRWTRLALNDAVRQYNSDAASASSARCRVRRAVPCSHFIASMHKRHLSAEQVRFPTAVHGETLGLRFSAGLAVAAPHSAMAQVAEGADRALYAAKQGGRDEWRRGVSNPHLRG
jgi:GGDEF domain-containing protein